MAYYLDMNGSSDYLRTPSLTFTDIYIDAEIEQRPGVQTWYVDARTGIGFAYFNRTTSNTDSISVFNAVYIDGVAKTSGTAFVPHLTRCMIRVVKTTGGTDDVNIFSANNGTANTKGKLYDVKFYNGATLVAHYNLTLGNAQDQSGNGNHATLNGGTFVSDGPTVIEKSAAIVGVSTVTASPNKRMTRSAAISGASTVTATARKVRQVAAAITGVASVTATKTQTTVRQVSASITGSATVTASKIKRLFASASIMGTAQASAAGVKMIQKSVAITGIGTMNINRNKPIQAATTLTGGRKLHATLYGGRKLHATLTGGVKN